MGSKFTPGPWYASYSLSSIEAADYEICQLSDYEGDRFQNYAANARLIAAAPELLEVLQNILSYWEITGESNLHIADIKSAIAKATGEQA